MRIGAYQFPVTGSIAENLKIIKKAIRDASAQGVSLLAFPECALTGYPPRDIPDSKAVDFEAVTAALNELSDLAVESSISVIIGTILKEKDSIYNSAAVLAADGRRLVYHKRALWGWDKNNFTMGSEKGVFELNGMKIGVRICFEVRFPEFFRELYREKTDLNVIIFYDTADSDNVSRYDLIEAHIRTRAVENVCHTLTVDAIKPYQTAPTAIYDRSGRILTRLERNTEGMLIYDLNISEPDFGEKGRLYVSDMTVGI